MLSNVNNSSCVKWNPPSFLWRSSTKKVYLVDEISNTNKQHENLVKFLEGIITNLKNEVKSVNENSVHEAQP